tara:strand:- start:693 stop:1082 length:390 start_codon:yes stop_codon:yes gene_type:complete
LYLIIKENIKKLKCILETTLVSLAIESWRLSKSFERLLIKSDPMEQRKYKSKLSWFNKKLNETLEEANLKFINLENQKYDTGAAVTAINLDDFQPDEDLEIDQMIEPIVMSNEGVLIAGTVVLRKRSAQ